MHRMLALAVWMGGCGGLSKEDPADKKGTECTEGCEGIPQTTRFARLTHVQWENTVQDLLGLDGPTGLSGAFMGDPLSEGFDNDAGAMQVGSELWSDYQRAAEELALRVVSEPDLYGHVVPQDTRTQGSAVQFEERAEAEYVGGTVGESVGDAWLLWSFGHIDTRFTVTWPGDYVFRMRMYADQGGMELAKAAVTVGSTTTEVEVTATSWETAETFELPATLDVGDHVLRIAFTNDFYEKSVGVDRNLYVDWVELVAEGTALEGPAPTANERDAWIADFGARVHRRPLTADEKASYTAIFDQGPELVGSGDAFTDGVRVTLEAMLQSPFFLYRIEESTDALEDGRIPLSSYELASKLSYALWNTMPDDELLRAAGDEELTDPEALRAQALRLLADERARATVADLHRQLLLLDNYDNIVKDPADFPEYTETLPASMRAEALAFVDAVVFRGEGVHALYTSNRTFVNADTARVYGLGIVTSDDLVEVELDPQERAGLLTLSGFLALESDGAWSSPIRRGAVANLRFLCADLPPPPDVVPPLPPADGSMTTRERVELHTGDGTCGQGCHSTLINPIGFGFENYDALGRYRTTEVGKTVDSSGSYAFLEGERSWENGLALAGILGDSLTVHRCYTQNLLSYLHGRAVEDEDAFVLDDLGTRSLTEDVPIQELMADLVVSESFRYRNPEVD